MKAVLGTHCGLSLPLALLLPDTESNAKTRSEVRSEGGGGEELSQSRNAAAPTLFGISSIQESVTYISFCIMYFLVVK